MITLYDLGNIQNKAQKAWEKCEEKKMEEVSVSVADTKTRFWSYCGLYFVIIVHVQCTYIRKTLRSSLSHIFLGVARWRTKTSPFSFASSREMWRNSFFASIPLLKGSSKAKVINEGWATTIKALLWTAVLCSVLAFLRRNKAVELWLGVSIICIDVVPHSMYYSHCHNGVRNRSIKIQLTSVTKNSSHICYCI